MSELADALERVAKEISRETNSAQADLREIKLPSIDRNGSEKTLQAWIYDTKRECNELRYGLSACEPRSRDQQIAIEVLQPTLNAITELLVLSERIISSGL